MPDRPLTNFLPFRAPATFAKHRRTRDRYLIRQPLLQQPLPQPRRLSRPPQCFSQELRYHTEQDVAQSLPRRFRLSTRSAYKQRGQWPDCGYFCKYRCVYSCYKAHAARHAPPRLSSRFRATYKGSDVYLKPCSCVMDDSNKSLTWLYTHAKRKPIMAMERFQRCRNLFTDFRSFQGDLSLLDGPANGMHT